MADNKLVGITLQLTDDQKRLLRQVSDEDYSEIVLLAGSPQQDVPSQFGANEDERKLVSVLYETNADLYQRIEQNPVIKKDIEDRIEVRGFGPTFSPGALSLQAHSFQGGVFNVPFQGLLGAAAAW